jgi:hypothetical protein
LNIESVSEREAFECLKSVGRRSRFPEEEERLAVDAIPSFPIRAKGEIMRDIPANAIVAM